ncbi:hypothetical protein Q1695_000394 [Nippostrongylus brasiliensis]|nr:hypothetical protein Q1695_000394 [Nippostrongylus brasiliensis]
MASVFKNMEKSRNCARSIHESLTTTTTLNFTTKCQKRVIEDKEEKIQGIELMANDEVKEKRIRINDNVPFIQLESGKHQHYLIVAAIQKDHFSSEKQPPSREKADLTSATLPE